MSAAKFFKLPNWKQHAKLSAGLICLHAVVIVALLHVWKEEVIWQIDLSEDQRYTLAAGTKELLQALEEELYIEVYLAGKLPPNFQSFRTRIQETLESMQQHSQGRLRYAFVDPAQAESRTNKERYYLELAQKGIQPTHLSYKHEGKMSTQIIFPGARLFYQGEEKSVMLLKGQGQRSQHTESMLQSSLEGIVYQLSTAIQSLLHPTRSLGLLVDQDIDSLRLWGLHEALAKKYNLIPLRLDKSLLHTGLEVLLMVKPQTPFEEHEIYHLDQFIMHGGRVLFFLDALHVNTDSLHAQDGHGTLAIPAQHGLHDLLFRYGLRLRPELVADLQCLPYPVITGTLGDKAQMNLLPWVYYPRITHFSTHPIVRNLDAVMLQYAGGLDTVYAPGIRKTPLFFTSPYSRSYTAPKSIHLNELRTPPEPAQFQGGAQAVAYLLEGRFSSRYQHRLPPAQESKKSFKTQSTPTRLMVVGDGDFVLNELRPQAREPLALGVYWPERAVYAHKDFLWQALEYLFDDQGIILTRNKRFLIRPLDKVRVRTERTRWQLLNLAGPLLLIGFVGILRLLYRRHKWRR